MIDLSLFEADLREEAKQFAVAPDIHPEDFIFQFLAGNPCFQTKTLAVRYYFSDGRKSVDRLESLVAQHFGRSDRPIELLEFASGFGCVSRHLVGAPAFHLTACDIHQGAIGFLRERIGAEALLSRSRPEDFAPGATFDICFALSFFSHMPDATWGPWLRRLYSLVKPGGLLIFTTHGYRSRHHFGDPSFNSDGYWFDQSSEQKDLSTGEYGQMIVTPRYVFNQIHLMNQTQALAGADVVFMQEGLWWDHQDTYILRKDSLG